MTIQEAKLFGKNELALSSNPSPTPVLDTEVLLQFITGLDKTHLLLNRGVKLSEEQENNFVSSINKRKTGFPIAYITGHKEFFGYDFLVTPDVLIPKPDTELLVELALDALEDKYVRHPDIIPSVCDMCAGSGCVGLSIAKALLEKQGRAEQCPETNSSLLTPHLSLTLADISEKALEIAKKNAERLLAPQPSPLAPHFLLSNLFENIAKSFDLIVTNPPYVPHGESIELLKDGRSEPLLALDGDVNENGESSGTNDGLALIRRLVPQCYDHLNPNGVLIMETGEYNAEETAELFKKAGFRNVRIEYDMNEMMRDVTGIK